jgi:hypothetical protein
MAAKRLGQAGAKGSQKTAYTQSTMKTAHAHPDKLLLYEKLVATNPKAELKGATA